MGAPDTTAVIELRLREVAQLFNSLDPSPFLERDLDVKAEEFIESWAAEIPSHRELALRVHLATPPTPALDVGEAVRAFSSIARITNNGSWRCCCGAGG